MSSGVFSASEEALLWQVSAAGAGMSFAGSLAIALSYALLPNTRRFSRKLVLYLSLADMGNAVFMFMGVPGDGTPLCYAQAIGVSVFELATVLWTFFIALTMFLIVVKHHMHVERYEGIFHACVWGFSVLMSLLPLSTDSVGSAGAWCWLRDDDTGTLWRLLQFFVPLWLVFVVSALLNILTFVEVRRSMRQFAVTDASSRELISASTRRMGMYPILLLIVFAFATVNRIQNWVDPTNPLLWLFGLHGFFAALLGSLNAIVYFQDVSMRREVRNYFRHCASRRAGALLCCCRAFCARGCVSSAYGAHTELGAGGAGGLMGDGVLAGAAGLGGSGGVGAGAGGLGGLFGGGGSARTSYFSDASQVQPPGDLAEMQLTVPQLSAFETEDDLAIAKPGASLARRSMSVAMGAVPAPAQSRSRAASTLSASAPLPAPGAPAHVSRLTQLSAVSVVSVAPSAHESGAASGAASPHVAASGHAALSPVRHAESGGPSPAHDDGASPGALERVPLHAAGAADDSADETAHGSRSPSRDVRAASAVRRRSSESPRLSRSSATDAHT